MSRADIVERGRALEVTALEDGLHGFWNETLRASEKPLHRTLTINLIGVCSALDEPALDDAIGTLFERHPCRAFRLVLRDEQDPLSADVEIAIREDQKERYLLYERVRIEAFPGDRPKLPGLVRPLLVDDVPTILVWFGRPPDDLDVFRPLCELADHAVFDASLLADPVAEAARLAALPVETVDLTWFRLRPWRRLLAQSFELADWHAEDAVAATIRHGAEPGARAAAALVRDWLSVRLGAGVRSELVEGGAPPCEPWSLEVAFADTTIRLEHLHPEPQIRALVTLGDRCALPIACKAEGRSRGDLLARALELL